MSQTGADKAAMLQYSHHSNEGGAVPVWPAWTIKEAAAQTGYHPEYLRQLCRAGKIEYSRAGTAYLIKISSLMRYIENLDQADERTGPKPGRGKE